MKVKFRDINFNDDNDCQTLVDWFNQDINTVSLSQRADKTVENVRSDYTKGGNNKFEAFFILVEDKPIGYASFLINPKIKISKFNVIWPSIIIGEKTFRRKGLVYRLGEELCRRATEYNATHIEAGIFSSNDPMVNLLKKYGFEEIGTNLVGPKKIPSMHYLREIPTTSV